MVAKWAESLDGWTADEKVALKGPRRAALLANYWAVRWAASLDLTKAVP